MREADEMRADVMKLNTGEFRSFTRSGPTTSSPFHPPSSPQILLFSAKRLPSSFLGGGGQTIFLLLGGDGVGLLEKPSQAAQSVACPAMINPPHLCTVLSTVYSDPTLQCDQYN